LFRYAIQNDVRKKGTKNVNIKTNGKERKRFTVALCVSASGIKLNPFVIFRGKKPELVKKVIVPKDVVAYKNPTAWMNGLMMKKWIREILKPWKTKTFTNKDTKKCILILDSVKTHDTEIVRNELKNINVIPFFIPCGLTPLLQPLDISVNRSFKCHLRTLWNDSMNDDDLDDDYDDENEEIEEPPEHEQTVILSLIDHSWKSVCDSVVINGFQKANLLI
jgi:DDE superfamily endonuclease